jgi:zinc/manganese transport system substrate-binding protein
MKRFIFILSAVCYLACGLPGAAEAKLKVVTTLSTFADLVKTIGQDEVDVSYVASPRFNPHFIEPKPSDVLKVKRANLFVHAGLDLELWRWPLVDAAGNTEVRPGGSRELDLSQGIRLLEVPEVALTRAAGDIHIYGNPHYWVNPENAKIMTQSICDKLCAIDPAHCEVYQKNMRDFHARLDRKISEWKEKIKPFNGKEVVGYHNSWPYMMEFLGLKMKYFLEPKPGIPPTPRQIELVEQRISNGQIPAIIQPTYYPRDAANAVSKKTGAKVVFLCENVGELPETSNYIQLIEYDVEQLLKVLK